MAELVREILNLAKESLKRQQRLNSRGLDESIFLEDFEEIVETKVTLAERLLAGWGSDQQKNLELVKRHCAFA